MGTPWLHEPRTGSGPGLGAGPPSDVYSLEATLYCLLTGKPPVCGAGPIIDGAQGKSAGDFPRPRKVEPNVPVPLEAICLKAMALAPGDRYSTPRALGDEIERWLADQPEQHHLLKPAALPARRGPLAGFAGAKEMGCCCGCPADPEHDRTGDLQLADHVGASEDDPIARHEPTSTSRELLKGSGENLLLFVCRRSCATPGSAGSLNPIWSNWAADSRPDPGIQLETSQVFRVIGGIDASRVNSESAANYEKAIKGLTTLCESGPASGQDYRRWLAEALNDRGELNHMNGRTIDAENDFRAAIARTSKLSCAAPVSAAYRRGMGSALINLSEVLVIKCQHTAAHAAADRQWSCSGVLACQALVADGTANDR